MMGMRAQTGMRGQGGGALLLVLLVLILAALAGGAIAYLIISRVDVTLMLREQAATAIIPQDITGTARVSEAIGLRLDETIHTQVPVDQRVTIPIKDRLDIVVHFDGEIPLRMNVRLRDEIPLKQVVDLDTVIDAYLPEIGSTITIPLRGKIPIDIMVPVDLVIPLDQMVALQFTTPITAEIDQKLTVPLRTSIDAAVPIDAALSVPVLNDLRAVVIMPEGPSDVVIQEADLTLPLRTLRLGFAQDKPAEVQP